MKTEELKKMSDNELVELIVKNAKENIELANKVFDVINNRHKKSIVNIIKRYTYDQNMISDIVQDTFIKAYDGIVNKNQFVAGNLNAWLTTIAKNDFIDLSRYNKRKNEKLIPIEEIEYFTARSKEQNPLEGIISKEILTLIEKGVESLNANQRLMYELRVKQDKSFKDISDMLGILMNTNLSTARYMRKALLKYFASVGYKIAVKK